MSYFNLYRHNFVRVAAVVPQVKVADPVFNAQETVRLAREAAAQGALLVVFPELGLSAYTCDDLFHQRALLNACVGALQTVREGTRELSTLIVVGMPILIGSMLFNCAVVLARGAIIGVVPKTYMPNYREFYELRQFVSARNGHDTLIDLCGESAIPFGPKQLFRIQEIPDFALAIEICEDLWTPLPPSSYAALAGATVIANLSASNATVGKDEYRQQLIGNQSARCIAGYVYTAAGFGESTTDLAWDGHALIYENGTQLAQSKRFQYCEQIIYSEIDLDRVVLDRMRTNTFAQTAEAASDALWDFHTSTVSLELPREGALPLSRRYDRYPFVPADPGMRAQRCQEIFEIQVQGLVKRMSAMATRKLVIGVSGGLDSAHALLVCAKAMDVLGAPRSNILAYTLPGYATSDRTLAQARRLMQAIGATASEIDIRPSCDQLLRDIGHRFVDGVPAHDTTFENVQAGARSQLLFRLANQNGAPVVGTSDLSELALGWCTYGVGDQMAHYHVNASVPKSLIQYLVRYAAGSGWLGADASSVLEDVLATPISPELIPGAGHELPEQETEAVVGPYELQDFNLYFTLRFGYSPTKIAFLAWSSWGEGSAGRGHGESDLREYSIGDIKRWLRVFAQRFFGQSQFKRSAMPNAPKVGSGGSLSPRGDYRAPSDSEATVWLSEVDKIPDGS